MALNARLMGAKGSSTLAYSRAHRWIRRVIPVNPPGNRSPAETKLLKFTEIISEDRRIIKTRIKNSFSSFFCFDVTIDALTLPQSKYPRFS